MRQLLPGLSVLAFPSRVPLRLHPMDIVSSLRRGRGCLPLVLEFSELEGANLIDFHLLFFLLLPPSPLTVRDFFWSVSVLTGSQLALDMSMSGAV